MKNKAGNDKKFELSASFVQSTPKLIFFRKNHRKGMA
jgi:hypothetical protein